MPPGIGRRRAPELLRLGVSHFLSAEQAAAIMMRPGRVARVVVRVGHAALTGRAGHVTVWASAEDLARSAELVE